MHLSSLIEMKKFFNKYVSNEKIIIVDIGSYNVNGSYKRLIKSNNKYIGIDIEEGPNVDVVLNYQYKLPFEDNSIDIVISGQAFEHMEYPWLMICEIKRVLKPNSYACIIAPSNGMMHYKIDCYRYFPDGMKALCKWSGLECIDCYLNENKTNKWVDCVLIASKNYD